MKNRKFSKVAFTALAAGTLVIGNFVVAPTHSAFADEPQSPTNATAKTVAQAETGSVDKAVDETNTRQKYTGVAQPSVKFGLGGTITLNDQKITLKERDKDNKAWYRIPALTSTPGGDLIAAFDERPLSKGGSGTKLSREGFNGENWIKLLDKEWKNGEDSPNPNYIVQYRSTDNGKNWTREGYICEGVASGDREKISGCSDPSYVVDWETGTIFNFHVRSYLAGIQSSQKGNTATDRNVIHVEVSESHDDGKTWTHKIITDQATPDANAQWRFAASGQGVQLTHPKHKGWLIQQFTRSDSPAGSGTQQAFSLISKDHGKTWEAGKSVGTKMDENKVVELSNGDLLLTSRNSGGPGKYDGVSHNRDAHRWQALSTDSGFTWGEVTQMPDIKEGKTNGQILRAFPMAKEEDPAAKILLYASSAAIRDQNSRGENNDRYRATIYLSCDNGTSWKQQKMFNEDTTGYITIAVQPDGRVGMLTEDGKDGYKDYGIYYRNFDIDYVGHCAGVKEYVKINALNEKVSSLEGKLNNATAEAKKAKEELAVARNELMATTKLKDQLAEQAQAKQKEVAKLEADKTALGTEIKKLKAAQDSQATTNNKAREENALKETKSMMINSTVEKKSGTDQSTASQSTASTAPNAKTGADSAPALPHTGANTLMATVSSVLLVLGGLALAKRTKREG